MTLEQRLKKLTKACAGLIGTEERPIARRNARARVLSALRAVRSHVDEVYPAIVKREGTKRLTVEGRIARLKRKGMVEVSATAKDLALRGVKIHTIVVRNPQDKNPPLFVERHFAPRWALELWKSQRHDDLRRAAKDKTFRRALQTEAAILQSN